jgi:hypothetical protein
MPRENFSFWSRLSPVLWLEEAGEYPRPRAVSAIRLAMHQWPTKLRAVAVAKTIAVFFMV